MVLEVALAFSAPARGTTQIYPSSRGRFLYYATAIDNTVLFYLINIGSEKARATSKTMDEVQ